MTHATAKTSRETAAAYKTDAESDAYLSGFDRGFNCASWQDLPEIGSRVYTESDGYVIVNDENQWDVVQSLAYDSESNGRQFSPFEFTASEFNSAEDEDGEDISEELWEAFDAGITDGIAANIQERMEQFRKTA